MWVTFVSLTIQSKSPKESSGEYVYVIAQVIVKSGISITSCSENGNKLHEVK